MVKKLIFCILICILSVGILTSCANDTAEFISSESDFESSQVTMSSENACEDESHSQEQEYIYVYVCGAVISPGVYSILDGSRICDLFQLAGGLAEDAATDYWNQARKLVDGEMIYVPTKEEALKRSEEEWDAARGQTNTEESEGENKKININTASLEELMTLPGIGESKALAILAYREESGSFVSIEDLKAIPGIKDGVYSKIEQYITVN